MKKITIFALFLVSMLSVSCSEESSSGNSGGGTVDDTEYFNHSIDDVAVPMASWTAIRSENTFEVIGEAEDGQSMFFRFNAFGDLDRATSTPEPTSDLNWMHNHFHYASNYFDFEIVAIDATNKIIKVNYSGNLYEEEFDLNSQSMAVEGTFNVHYVEVTPQVAGLGLSADINGVDWHSVKYTTTISGSANYTLDFYSDDRNMISLHFVEGVTTGTYAFSPSSQTSVTLSRYDVASGSYIEYNCTGTVTISEAISEGMISLIAGTYSFTAVDPDNGSIINVADGTFKTIY